MKNDTTTPPAVLREIYAGCFMRYPDLRTQAQREDAERRCRDRLGDARFDDLAANINPHYRRSGCTINGGG